MLLKKVLFITFGLTLLLGAQNANAEAISLNFVSPPTDGVTPDPAILEPNEVAGFFPSNNWNNVELPLGGGAAYETLDDMNDNNGVVTTADFIYTTTASHGMFTDNSNAPPYIPSDKKIVRRYLNQYGDGDGSGGAGDYVAEFEFSSLPTSVTENGYDVIVYVSSPANPNPRFGQYQLDEGIDSTIDQTIYTWEGSNPWSGTYVDGGYATLQDANDAFEDANTTEGNYIRFNGLTDSSFKLIMDAVAIEDYPDRASINGIQIVGVGTQPDGACGDTNHPYPAGDLNLDCNVNLKDISEIAANWLECTDPEPPCNYNPFQ